MNRKSMKRSAFFLPVSFMLYLLILHILPPAKAAAEDRVARARSERETSVKKAFADAGVSYPPAEMFIRSYKKEMKLELWAGSKKGDPMKPIKTYPVCASSGKLGPKRKEGDLQVPEGVYRITGLNPMSRFHLSLRINYPNESDRILSDKTSPGGDIYIHGNCVTIGCIPIRDEPVEELYIAVLDYKTARGSFPEVHIYPCDMNGDACIAELGELGARDEDLASFWVGLARVHAAFEKNKRPPKVRVDGEGRYVVSE